MTLAALSRLHHDLSIDEPFTALALADPASLRATLVHDNVPLFYLLLKAWTRVFGSSAFALRAMSMAAFGGAIVFGGAAAKHAASWRAAWLTAILIGGSVTFGLQPAATARPYALVALWAGMTLWAALRVDTAVPVRARAALLASHLLGLFTHPMFVFVSAASAAAGLTFGGRHRRLLAAAPAVALGIYLATWWRVIKQTAALPIRTWMAPPTMADLLTGSLFWGDHSTPLLAALVVVLLCIRRRIADDASAQAMAFALTTAVLVIAGAFTVSHVTPVYLPARTPIFVVPFVAMVFGIAIAELGPAIVTMAAMLLVVVSAARFTIRSSRGPDPFPTRASLAAVASRAACGDTIVAAGLS